MQRPVRLAYQPPANSIFSLTTNQPLATSQQYSSLRTNQHQPSATSQPNRTQVVISLWPSLSDSKKKEAEYSHFSVKIL
jgi:hypothetical protein